MNAGEFVAALRTVVSNDAARDLLQYLEAPPGRAPAKNVLELSAWYLRLAEEDRAMLRRVVEMSVDSTVFGVLCVLDGVRVIEDPPGRGELVLEHIGPRGRTRLNGPGEALHELW